MSNTVFNNNYVDLNLFSFFDKSGNTNEYAQLIKGNDRVMLEVLDEREENVMLFKDTPIELGNLDTFFLERVGITKNGVLEGFDPLKSGGTYRMRRSKRKNMENDEFELPNKQYPYNPIRTPVPIPIPPSKKIKIDKKKIIKTVHWNANSVVGKNNSIWNLIEEERPDIVSLNETRTNSTTEAYLYELSKLGYYPVIRSRKIISKENIITNEINLNGGGVALLIKDTIAIMREIELPGDLFTLEERASIEIVGATIKIGEKDVTFFSLYNPPETLISDKLLRFIVSHGDFVLQGDLNAKMSQFGETNKVGRELERSLSQLNCTIINRANTPTFYRYIFGELSSSSILDYIITNVECAPKVIDIEIKDMSAVVDRFDRELRPSYFHLPIVAQINFEAKPKKSRTSFHDSFLYERANWGKVIKSIETELVNGNCDENDIDSLNGKITEAIKRGADANIPKSREKLKRDFNYPAHIVQILQTRNFWAKKFRENRNELFAKKYRSLQNEANTQIVNFKRQNWEAFLIRQGKSPLSSAPFWKRINRLRECKRRKAINSIVINGNNVNESKKIADVFAENLEKKFKSDDNQNYDMGFKVNIENYMNLNFENSYTQAQKNIPEFTMKELEFGLKTMNKKTSIDPQGISNKIVKNVLSGSTIIKNEILKLFNKCITESIVPSSWKESVITMLAKSGLDKTSPDSHRPISSTPCIARLFERLVLVRLQDHLKKK